MKPGESRDDRFATLLLAASELDSVEEKRDFLNRACDGDPELLADLLETVTLHHIPDDPPPGESRTFPAGHLVADRFQIVRQLGEGGMAVVYEAMDLKLMERRALKFPKAGHSGTMPPEARSALRVTHDNICRTHEIHTTDTGAGPADFLSMEFLEGETLLSRWRREPIPTIEAIEIARQLCRGLAAAHKAHILHRDLKSNNVMLTRHADQSIRVVITDFGLARAVAQGDRPASSSLSGTFNYIAPERFKGAAATPASDIYALGITLYEMLTGRLPYPKGTAWQKRLNELPEPPSKSERAPDARWDPIALRCLDPDPAKRFASAGEVLEAVERAFRVTHRKKWMAAAAVALMTVTPAMVWRDRIWPPPSPLARMAVLPFSSSAVERSVDEAVKGGLFELAGRLESLGASSRRVIIIPPEDSVRYEVDSPAKAAARLGATHALSGTIGMRNKAVAVHAVVTDLSNGETVREFTGEFQPGDLAALSTSLAGVVTSAFHLDKSPPASALPAAYPDYAAGLASVRSGALNYERAIASFDAALKKDRVSPLIHAGLAEAYLQKFTATKDPQWLAEASTFARRAESLHPDSPPVLLVLGAIEDAEGKPERAIEIFRRAADLEPKNAQAWWRTGMAFQRITRDAEATGALRKAIQLAPDYFAYHLSLGFVHFQRGRYSEAVEEYRTVTKLAPELPVGHSSLGAALLASGQEAEAERALRQSLKLRPTRSALNNLGVLLRYQGRDVEAAKVMTQALQEGSDDAVIRLNLGDALRRTGRISESREHYQKANDLARVTLLRDPRDAAARVRRAYSMVRLGTPAMAADEALQAARLAPADYSVLFWSVKTLDALGRRKDAFPLLATASYERLRDLGRQPDLADFARDPQFIDLLGRAKGLQSERERNKDANVRN